MKIHIGRSVDLYGLYVQDLHKDTLLYAGSLQVTLSNLSFSKKHVTIKGVLLKDALFNHVQYKGEEEDNLAFLARYFASSDTLTDTTTVPWQVQLPGEGGVELSNVHFRNIVQDDTLVPGVDFSHLDVTGIFGKLKHIRFEGDSVFVKLEQLRFRDHSGFRLDELSADAKVSSDEMRLIGLTIRTPQTDLHTDLTFRYDSFACFSEFLTCIRFESDFSRSKISFRDIGYFAEDVKTMGPDVTLSGKFKGTVSGFKGKNVEMYFGKQSVFRGNIAMKGLPDIDETFMEFEARELLASKHDLELLRFPGEAPGNRIILAGNFDKLGLVSFRGRFTGFTNDFVAYGDMRTAIGYISTDINLKFDRRKNETRYTGHLSTRNFDAGQFWSMPDFGAVTLSADVKGSGLSIDNMNTTLSGTIGSMLYRGYEYRDIRVSADIAKKLFNGTVTIHEPNVDLDFAGKINFQDKLPHFNFTADLKSLQLDQLHLLSFTRDANVAFHADIELTGDKVDNLTGTLAMSDINYREEKVLYHVNKLEVVSAINTSGERSVNIESDNVNAAFYGRFEFETLGDAFKQVLPRYLPALLPLAKVIPARQDFKFDIHLKNASLLTKLFMPGWYFDANTMVKGHFNSIQNSFQFTAHSPEVRFGSLRMHQLEFSGNTDESTMNASLKGDRLYYSDSGHVEQPSLKAGASANRIDFALQLADSATYNSRVYMHGGMVVENPHRFTIALDSSNLMLNKQSWQLSPGNQVVIDSSSVSVSGFQLTHAAEIISLGGTVSKNKNDKIAVGLKNFRLENLNPFLESSGTVLNGIGDGSFFLEKGSQSLMLQSDLVIDSLQLNGDTLGKAIIRSGFSDADKILTLNASITRGSAVTLVLSGAYQTAKKEDNLDFDIRLNSIYLNTLAQYVGTVISDLKGKASAELKLTGSLERPVVNGVVNLTKASCRVNYLGTRYSFTDDVQVTENKFLLNNFKLNDGNGKQAQVNGEIRHSYFKKFDFDLSLKATDFECLNTTALQNALYYGKAIGTGYATFKGPLNHMNISITMASRKGTIISIPLGGGEELSRNEFITFVKKDTLRQEEDRPIANPSGINLEMTFSVTPEAEMQLIFDEKIGDVINGSGKGDIRILVTDDGTFKMYGSYFIEKGTYLFTLRNVINKRFQIEKGGVITWTGDPYDADINMNATYKLSTSTLYNLIADSTYKKRLEVHCQIFLSNKLMNPTIRYAIDVPSVDGAAQSQISSVLNSEAEVSKQFFGLLVLGQFIPPGNSNQAATPFDASVGANTAELLSNQVSNWLSQMNTPVGLGFDYQAKDAYSDEQWKVILSKSFWNDRLVVDAAFGVYTSSTAQSENTNTAVGDFNAEYKVSQDGRFRLKAYNHSNENSADIDYAPYTQGFGALYREEFDSLKELLIRWRLKKKDPEPNAPVSSSH